jgi:5-methylcytosine-specific restriction enzyme A
MPFRPPVHQPAGSRTDAQRRAERVASMPSPSRTYGRRWQKLRAAYLATHPLCECGCGFPATVVDHRVPHNGDDRLMYAWSNLQAMTAQCHNAKTAARDGGFGNPVRVS